MVLFNLQFTPTKGFSLLELVLVMAIAAIVAAWSLAGIVQYAAHQEVNRSVTELTSFVNETRQRTVAAETDTQFGIVFATSSVIRFEGSTFDPTAATNAEVVLPGVELITNLTDGSNAISFSRLRGLSSATGTVQVIHPRSGREVGLQVLKTGNIVRP